MRFFVITYYYGSGTVINYGSGSGIVDTGGKFAIGINNTSKTGGIICRRCRWHRWQICHQSRWYGWCTLTCEYLCEFLKNFEMVLMEYSGAGGKLIHEKNQKQKISWHCPFKEGINAGQETNLIKRLGLVVITFLGGQGVTLPPITGVEAGKVYDSWKYIRISTVKIQ